MADDPYAGIGTPVVDPAILQQQLQAVQQAPAQGAPDPYAGIGTPAPAPAQVQAPWGGPSDPATAAAAPLTIKADPPPPSTNAAWAAVSGAINGVPVVGPYALSGLQHLSAWQRSMDNGTSFDDELAAVQGADRARQQGHPYATMAGNVAGGIVGTAPLIATAPAAFGIGDGALAARMLSGAGSGAAIGGVDAAARSSGTATQRLADTAIGAGLGGGFGGIAPAIGSALGGVYGRLAGQSVQDTADTPASVRTEIVKALRQDATLDPVGNLASLGPQGMLADLGPSLKGIAMGQAAKDGAGGATILDALRTRDQGTSDRILSDLSSAIGPAQNADAVARQIQDFGQGATQPYFQRAYQAGVPQGADVDALMQRPAVVGAVRDAATTAANQGTPFPTVTLDAAGNQVGPQAALDAANAATRPAVDNAVGALLGNQGGTISTAAQMMQQRAAAAAPLYRSAYAARMTPDQIPVGLMPRLELAGAVQSATRDMRLDGVPVDLSGVQGWDYMKRALDQQIGVAQRGGQNNDARILKGLKKELTGALDAAVPDYAAARQAFAGPSDMISALQQGQEAASSGVTREQVAGDFAQLGTDGERQMYRLGLGNAYRENLARAGDASNFADRVAGNQQVRDKLASVAPSPQALAAFNAHMDAARQTFSQAQRPTPLGLHNTLDTLDARAVSTGDAGVAAARDALAARLGQNPDFARGRALQIDYGNPAVPGSGALPQALDAGRTALRGGPNAIHPDDYAAAFAARGPAAQETQRIGLNSDIYRQLGDKPNDLVALKNVVKGDNDRSRAVIASTYGQSVADRLANTVAREATMAETYGDVLRNSMTARRNEMIAAQKAGDYDPFQIHERHDLTLEGAAYTAATKPVNALLRLLQPPKDTAAHDMAVSRVVTATGDDKARLLGQILRNQNAIEGNAALGAPVDTSVTSLGAVSPAVLAALLRGRQPEVQMRR